MRLSFVLWFLLMFMTPAYSITCNLGYYNKDDGCVKCEPGYFCASGIRTACADATNNLYPYSDAGAYDVVWCYLVATPGKYVGTYRGGLTDCDTTGYCPGNIRVYYGLPDGYRMTKYTTINNSPTGDKLGDVFNGVNTGIEYKESDAIDFAFSTTDNSDPRILFFAGYDEPQVLTMAYVASSGENMFAQTELKGSLFPVLSREQIGNGEFRSVHVDFSNDLSQSVYFGSWADKFWSRTINWYGFKILKSGRALQNLIPAVRESDDTAGFYDVIGGTFYTNHEFGGIPFTPGDATDVYACPDGMYYAGRGICRNCPTGLRIPDVYINKSQSMADCGRVMRFGGYSLYLRGAQRTHPSLAVGFGDNVLYGDMIPGREHGHLRVEYNGVVYSVVNMDADN